MPASKVDLHIRTAAALPASLYGGAAGCRRLACNGASFLSRLRNGGQPGPLRPSDTPEGLFFDCEPRPSA
ncbi:hypothetical protein [Paenibacillus sp. GCM10012303]|uniref:hypothetical protein n=1 Tax=Paenibacillus sp. GCM10012303 TaxID=3317340 RepID=UPI00360C1566